jgi:hypothetical protein
MRTLIVLLLIGLTACKSADRKTKQISKIDSGQIITQQQQVADTSLYALDTPAASETVIQQQEPGEPPLYVPDTTTSIFSGDTAAQIKKTLQFITAFDNASAGFHKDSFDVYEETTEGCEIIVVNDSASGNMKFYGTLYGEMGKEEFTFYTHNGQHPRLTSAIFTDISYNKPMYMKDSHISNKTTTYHICSDNNLVAVLDNKKRKQKLSPEDLRHKKREMLDFFITYIGQITANSQ